MANAPPPRRSCCCATTTPKSAATSCSRTCRWGGGVRAHEVCTVAPQRHAPPLRRITHTRAGPHKPSAPRPAPHAGPRAARAVGRAGGAAQRHPAGRRRLGGGVGPLHRLVRARDGTGAAGPTRAACRLYTIAASTVACAQLQRGTKHNANMHCRRPAGARPSSTTCWRLTSSTSGGRCSRRPPPRRWAAFLRRRARRQCSR